LYSAPFVSNSTNTGPDGSFENGDTAAIYKIGCSAGTEFGSICPVVCRPGYTVNSHYGNVAVCTVTVQSNQGMLQWFPVAPTEMCTPDIVMGTPNQVFRYQASVNTGANVWDDLSGNGVIGMPVKTAAVSSVVDGPFPHWVFAGTTIETVPITAISGENIFLRSAQQTITGSGQGFNTQMSLFIVAQTSVATNWVNLIDMLNLPMFFSTAPPECQPIDDNFHVFAFILDFSANAMSYSLRLDGKSCVSNVPVPANTVTHTLKATRPVQVTIGCAFNTATPGLNPCATPTDVFTGKIAEMTLFAPLNLKPMSCFTPPETAETPLIYSTSVMTTCSQYKLEAIEYFLLTKHAITPYRGKNQCVATITTTNNELYKGFLCS